MCGPLQALTAVKAPSACLSISVSAQPRAPGMRRRLVAVPGGVAVVVEVAAAAETGDETSRRAGMVAVVEVEAAAATESS